jgi:hypothetical protein
MLISVCRIAFRFVVTGIVLSGFLYFCLGAIEPPSLW